MTTSDYLTILLVSAIAGIATFKALALIFDLLVSG